MGPHFGNLFWRGGPWVLCLCGNHAVRKWKKNIGNFTDGFISHGAKNKSERAIFIKRGDRGTQRPCASGVVRYIEHNLRKIICPRYHLKPGGPARYA